MIHVFWDEELTRVVLSGDIGAGVVTELEEAAKFVRTRRRPLKIDVRHVTTMDATGFAGFAKLVLSSHNPVTVVYPSPMICFILGVSGLNNHLEIINQEDMADDLNL